MQADPDDAIASPPPPRLALLHRWFIQYNPLYLVSAAVVLWGMITLQRSGLSQLGTHGQLAITAIAEAYAWALVAGVALLMQLRLRRPALMLALLTAAFQADLTLHTETAPHLGIAGAIASALWVGSAAAKLWLLVRALKLRVAASVIAVPVLGAGVLAALPWWLRGASSTAGSRGIAVVLFAVFAAALWTRREIASKVALDEWGQRVAARAQHAVWIGWGVMLLLHASFWVTHHPGFIDTSLAVPVAALLATRFLRRELGVWLAVAASLGLSAVMLPQWFGTVAALAAVTLALHALRRPTLLEAEPAASLARDPYRDEAAWPPEPPQWALLRASRPACVRLGTGVLACVYLACWSLDHSGAWWRHHTLWLDAALLVVTALASLRAGTKLPWLVPAASGAQLASAYVHRVLPQSHTGQALAWVGLGFALLFASLLASYRWRRSDPGG